mgnify:CR=1 FL=1|jgi:hypothetical protein
MNNIIILYEHVSREYDACQNLANELEKYSNTKVYIYSLHFQVIDMLALWLRKKISAIIVPYAYKELSIIQISIMLRKKDRPYVFNLHHEQIGAAYNEFKHFPTDPTTKNKLIHLTWTNSFKEKLIKSGVSSDIIHVTGNMRSDIKHSKGKYSRNELCSRYNLNPNKTLILICETRTSEISNKEIDIMVNRGFELEDLRLLNHETKKALDAFYRQLNNLRDSFFNDSEIIYRPHPGTKINHFIDKRISIVSHLSINDWLRVVDVNVSRLSTTLFESEAFSVPTLRYDPTYYPARLVTFGLEKYRTIQNISEINSDLLSKATSDLLSNNIYQEYIGQSDGKSAKRTAQVISNVLNDVNGAYKKGSIIIDFKKFYFRKLFSNVLARFIYMFNFPPINIISKSLSVFGDDIPPTWRRK